MKLRYCVKMESCLRQGVDCSSRVQVIEFDPKELSIKLRNAIADRVETGQHLGEEVLDVCWLDSSEARVEEDALHLSVGEGGSWDPDFGHLLTADLPGFEHLVKAIEEEERELDEYVRENNLKFSKRFVMKGLP